MGSFWVKACNVGLQFKEKVHQLKRVYKGKLIQSWAARLYMAHNKKCLNYVYACMYKCGFEKNHGKF